MYCFQVIVHKLRKEDYCGKKGLVTQKYPGKKTRPKKFIGANCFMENLEIIMLSTSRKPFRYSSKII